MSWSLIANALNKAQFGPIITAARDTTGADLLIVGTSQYSGDTFGTVSDSKGNNWTPLTLQASGAEDQCRLFYAASPLIVGTGHTFTFDNGGLQLFGALAVAAFSGSASSPFDLENGAVGTSVGSQQPGSLLPSQDGELVVTAICTGSGMTGSYSVGSSFSITDQIAYGGGVNEGLALAYLAQMSAASVNPSWSWTGTADGASAVIASFKMAGVTPLNPTLMGQNLF